jgi:Uma2 family endonuclease
MWPARIIMSTIARLTLAEYDRMIGAAVFNRDRRVELIRGELRDMSPIGDRHRHVVNLLLEWATDKTAVMRDRLIVQVQNPVRLPAQDSAPLPDMSWIARESSRSSPPEGDEAFLVIEVADSTLAYDRGEKAALYAEAAVPDYWIVNLVDDCVEVHRDPANGRDQTRIVYRAGEDVRPLLFADCRLQISSLLRDR